MKLGFTFILFFGLQIFCSAQLLNKPAPIFVLSTQFGKSKKENFNEGKSIILVIADKKSKNEPLAWSLRLDKDFKNKIAFIKIAHIGAVPNFMRSTVMYFLKKEPEMMIDWEGDVCEKYQYKPERCSLFYINPKGIIKAEANGQMTESKYNDFANEIKKDLK